MLPAHPGAGGSVHSFSPPPRPPPRHRRYDRLLHPLQQQLLLLPIPRALLVLAVGEEWRGWRGRKNTRVELYEHNRVYA